MSSRRTLFMLMSLIAWLTLLPVVAFTQAPSPQAAAALGGPSWQLVAFRGGAGEVVRPDDGLKYTLAFSPDGQVTARLDCNRGRGSWMSSGPGRIEFGPLALTRAFCPPESMHDRIVRQWAAVRSYTIRDGHLLLGLIADGSVYEFAPLPPSGK
jgi:para-nitrobenzyl esterase